MSKGLHSFKSPVGQNETLPFAAMKEYWLHRTSLQLDYPWRKSFPNRHFDLNPWTKYPFIVCRGYQPIFRPWIWNLGQKECESVSSHQNVDYGNLFLTKTLVKSESSIENYIWELFALFSLRRVLTWALHFTPWCVKKNKETENCKGLPIDLKGSVSQQSTFGSVVVRAIWTQQALFVQ